MYVLEVQTIFNRCLQAKSLKMSQFSLFTSIYDKIININSSTIINQGLEALPHYICKPMKWHNAVVKILKCQHDVSHIIYDLTGQIGKPYKLNVNRQTGV